MMFEDLMLILIAIASASGFCVADSAHLVFLMIICALIFTATIFWMGVRSGRGG